jgi:cytidylate kinase
MKRKQARNRMNSINVIAIDGPAASGKSTIGRMLAERLGYLFLDTGSMYRAVTLAGLKRDIDLDDETAVTSLARAIEIDVQPVVDEKDGRLYTVLVNGVDVTLALRSPSVDANVSQVASYAGVRRELVQQQRRFGRRGHIVMVGRDIGTVVVPHAPVKLYVTASAEERARRRWQERQKQGHTADYERILADGIRRDEVDSNRQHSPLRAAEDAIKIDTTGRSPQTIVAEILALEPFQRQPLLRK